VTADYAANVYEAMLFITQYIHIPVCGLVCRIFHNELSIPGHESFKTEQSLIHV